MTTRYASIEIAKEDIHFSAAHFTIFSAATRENLHGHNFFVAASAHAAIGADGLCFDYNRLKQRLRALCAELDETVLLPTRSPHLGIEREGEYIVACFANERLPFLARDVKLLPIANTTVEELAEWFMATLRAEHGIETLPIDRLEVGVSSGPGQWARVQWARARQEQQEQQKKS